MFFIKGPKEKVLEMLAEASPETYLLQCCCFSPCASAGGLAGASEVSLRAKAGVKKFLALALPHPRSLGCPFSALGSFVISRGRFWMTSSTGRCHMPLKPGLVRAAIREVCSAGPH